MISPTMQGKRITVYVNGDPFMKGKVVTLNTHQIPEFDVFCEFLTERVPNRTGGRYRRIYTPNGSEVRALDQIEAGHEYVASKDRYRPPAKDYGYKEIPDRMRPRRHKGYKKIDIERIYKVVQHARDENLRKKSAMCYKLNEAQVGLRLQVSKNGDNISGHHIVKIEAKKKHDLQTIKNEIQDALGEQPIRRIFKVFNYGGSQENFHEVNDPQELSCGDHVLVMFYKDHDLKPLSYTPHGRNPFRIQTSPRNYPTFPALHDTPINRYKKLPSIGSSKQSEANTVSPFSNTPHSHPGRKTKRSKGAREVDYDRDEGGVYRSKKQNHARGAHQEEIHTKEKTTPIPPGTDLNKQQSKEKKQNADNASQTKNKSEVKKGGKSGKDMNKVSVLPPIVDDGSSKNGTEKVKKQDLKDIKEGQVKETDKKYESKGGERAGEEGLFVDEKEPTPKDLKTDDVIEISEREITPKDLESNNVEVNKPPLSTTPPQGKLSQASGKIQERVDEDAGQL